MILIIGRLRRLYKVPKGMYFRAPHLALGTWHLAPEQFRHRSESGVLKHPLGSGSYMRNDMSSLCNNAQGLNAKCQVLSASFHAALDGSTVEGRKMLKIVALRPWSARLRTRIQPPCFCTIL